MLAAHLAKHVIYDLTMLVLRTEQDDLGIIADFDRVSGWPVEQVTAVDHFICAVCVGDGEFTPQQVAPVRGLAQVALQPLEERRDVRTGAERKVLAADLAVPGRVTEIRLLSGYGAWYVDSDWYVLLGYAHRVFLRCGR
jgi:hypothetical protein